MYKNKVHFWLFVSKNLFVRNVIALQVFIDFINASIEILLSSTCSVSRNKLKLHLLHILCSYSIWLC